VIDMLPKIHFSNEYFKLMGCDRRAILLNVFKTHYNELDKNFIAYDTCYEDEKGNLLYYKLPKTELLCLLFFSRNGELFTTLRRFTPEKERYYESMVGKWFYIEVGGD